jgi:hypothetical protein
MITDKKQPLNLAESGNCLKPMLNDVFLGSYEDYIPLIDDNTLDLVITDPPYWHKKSPGKPYSERSTYETESKFANSDLYKADGFMMKNMSDFTDKDVELFLNLLKPKMKIMNAYIFCNDTLVPYYCMWAEKNKLLFSILVWEKPLSIINKNRFSQNIEYIVRIYDYGTALNPILLQGVTGLTDWEIYDVTNAVSFGNPTGVSETTSGNYSLLAAFVTGDDYTVSVVKDGFTGTSATFTGA